MRKFLVLHRFDLRSLPEYVSLRKKSVDLSANVAPRKYTNLNSVLLATLANPALQMCPECMNLRNKVLILDGSSGSPKLS